MPKFTPDPRPHTERFWDHVEKADGCWLWIGSKDKDGYGLFRWHKEIPSRRAHAFSYELAHGVSLPKGQVVCHACDTRACVRPDHLWLGGHVANIADRHQKGRTACGSQAGPAKLTEDQVAQIRTLYGGRYKHPNLRELGEMFGVTHDCIWRIVTYKNWR